MTNISYATMSYIVFTIILASILVSLNFIFAIHAPYKEKKTPFECGYHSFLQNRIQFVISFFVFALLFLLFDLEIVLIYPWTVSSDINLVYGLTLMILFVITVTIGFVFEFGKKALTIESRQFSLEEKYSAEPISLFAIYTIQYMTAFMTNAMKDLNGDLDHIEFFARNCLLYKSQIITGQLTENQLMNLEILDQAMTLVQIKIEASRELVLKSGLTPEATRYFINKIMELDVKLWAIVGEKDFEESGMELPEFTQKMRTDLKAQMWESTRLLHQELSWRNFMSEETKKSFRLLLSVEPGLMTGPNPPGLFGNTGTNLGLGPSSSNSTPMDIISGRFRQ